LISFKEALDSKDFVVTTEIFLHPETDREVLALQTDKLRNFVDSILVTDNQSGRLHMSSLAAAIVVKQNDIDPILQLSCRNRNRIALLADLLGAGIHGINSLQLVRGERVPDDFTPRPRAVLDISATELLATANKMKTEGGLGKCPDFLLGGLVTARKPKDDWVPHKVVQKIDAGARFLLTHACMNTELLQSYAKHLVAARITHRAKIIVTTAVLRSAEDARWLRENRPNVIIPKRIVKRLEQSKDSRAEGIAICAEQIRELAAMPGISGVHVIASSDLLTVPESIAASGIRSET
jgi:methylenetetrahydrofolate reductase (NADPH)